MKRNRLSGYFIAIDEERGTFTIHQTWWHNLRCVAIKLTVIAIFFGGGVPLTGAFWFGEPGVPVDQWRWYHPMIFVPFGIFLSLLGVTILGFAICLLHDVVSQLVRGFPPIVLDRVAAKCRDCSGSVFPIEGLDSVKVLERGGGDDALYYVLNLQFREGKSRELNGSVASTRASCEALQMEVARFLNVSLSASDSNG